jgi:DNA-binding response OmpR family regulator
VETKRLALRHSMKEPAATILLIEDHSSTRAFLAENLSADGYEVLQADRAGDAEHLIASEFPDLAILDLALPDRDGLELLREVRHSDRIAGRFDPDLPILVLSGRVSELDCLRGFRRGCDD